MPEIKYNSEYYQIKNIVTSKNKHTYEINDIIGSGGNAIVCECFDANGNEYAIKLLLKKSQKIKQRFQQEIEALKKIDHPHFVKYIDDGITVASNNGNHFEISFLVMEKADGNLASYLKLHKDVPYAVYAPQIRGLSEALKQLHQFAIHRDIKPENILVKGETWMLSDLGLCTYFSDDDNHIDITSQHEKVGPKYWMSPEAANKIYDQQEEINTASDVFQLCMIFWFIINNRQPIGIVSDDDWKNEDKTLQKIIMQGLSHNFCKRPQNGDALYKLVYDATINK